MVRSPAEQRQTFFERSEEPGLESRAVRVRNLFPNLLLMVASVSTLAEEGASSSSLDFD